ncbi:hypothetical protein [Mesorhizobium silamurunense]|uniref:hypothetical protein n=1 Tax=Mesorhizobium silamurunense TaxID=499528 RepID=UPI001FF05566|nr:hypothetical protein [Mesorhizobium silamurunense]
MLVPRWHDNAPRRWSALAGRSRGHHYRPHVANGAQMLETGVLWFYVASGRDVDVTYLAE